MLKILLVTVGGSPQPLFTAIEALQPDRTIFFCSDGAKGSKNLVVGAGKPCKIRQNEQLPLELPNIPTHLELTNFVAATDLVIIQNPDDLAECYQRIAEVISLLKQSPNTQIVADYTSGTKTMSAALAMAIADKQEMLYVTTSTNRENLTKVERGEATERVRTVEIVVKRKIEQFLPPLLKQYNYTGAIAELKSLLQLELSAESRTQVRKINDYCHSFDDWDRFNHKEALQLIQPYMNQPKIRDLGMFLKRIISSRAEIDEQFSSTENVKCHGYEIVEDLLLNAERRANQQRYDDAVGRLYRALELLAQICLSKKYDLKTGDVEVDKLPESLHQSYAALRANSQDGKIQLPLHRSYTLLSELPDEPLGKIYQQQASKIQNALKIRNYSLFAHGFSPIRRAEYKDFSEVVVSFITSGITTLIPAGFKSQSVQFPQELNDA
jgi:CRISPR-associated protein (TIGR02710 family)